MNYEYQLLPSLYQNGKNKKNLQLQINKLPIPNWSFAPKLETTQTLKQMGFSFKRRKEKKERHFVLKEKKKPELRIQLQILKQKK